MEGGKPGEEITVVEAAPQKKQSTVPEPFKLTKPKPKVLPQPEVFKKEVKSNPVPKGLFAKKLEDIEKEKEARRKEKVNVI